MSMNKIDSPASLIRALRKDAQQMREDASELQSAWQDLHAGNFWIKAAAGFDRLADSLEKYWSKI